MGKARYNEMGQEYILTGTSVWFESSVDEACLLEGRYYGSESGHEMNEIDTVMAIRYGLQGNSPSTQIHCIWKLRDGCMMAWLFYK